MTYTYLQRQPLPSAGWVAAFFRFPTLFAESTRKLPLLLLLLPNSFTLYQLQRKEEISLNQATDSFFMLCEGFAGERKLLFPLQKSLFNKEKLFDIPFLSKSRKEKCIIFFIVSANTIRIFTNAIRKPSHSLIVFTTQKRDRYAQHIEGGKRKPPSATKNKNPVYKSR